MNIKNSTMVSILQIQEKHENQYIDNYYNNRRYSWFRTARIKLQNCLMKIIMINKRLVTYFENKWEQISIDIMLSYMYTHIE